MCYISECETYVASDTKRMSNVLFLNRERNGIACMYALRFLSKLFHVNMQILAKGDAPGPCSTIHSPTASGDRWMDPEIDTVTAPSRKRWHNVVPGEATL